jgi:hypothetical protein
MEDTERNDNKIIFFGCWNNMGCNPGKEGASDLTKTIELLDGYLHSPENRPLPNHLIVAGDNYYPEKDKDKTKEKKEKKKGGGGEKTINLKNLRSGFECISNIIDIPNKHILFGNHDLENIPYKETPTDKCPILTEQLNFQDRMKFFNFHSLILPHMFFNNTLVVMIDSTMYEPEGSKTRVEDEMKLMDCYEKFGIRDITKKKKDSELTEDSEEPVTEGLQRMEDSGELVTTIDGLKANQTQQALNLIKYLQTQKTNTFRNIIFISHHPLLGVKQKFDEEINDEKLKPVFLKGLKDLELLFMNEFEDCSFFHFSADVHQLQYSLLTVHDNENNKTFHLKQIIVGTGGATKDKTIGIDRLGMYRPEFLSNNNFKNSGIDYVIAITNDINGFLEVDLSSGNVAAKFFSTENGIIPIPLDSGAESSGGGMKKRHRRRYSRRRKTNRRRSKKSKGRRM